MEESRADEIFAIWDEVVSRIIDRMLEISNPYISEIHINLREERILALAQIQLFLSEEVVRDRMADRTLDQISPDEERGSCLRGEGIQKIENTAKNLAEIWIKKHKERWEPKTEAALEKERNPKKTKLYPKKGEENHFIPKSFIKRYWSTSGKVCRYIKNSEGSFDINVVSFGQWGYGNELYSDRLEAYFGLVEGDAARPIEMLLNVEPLNRPQKESLIGFIVIQRLRNPDFMKILREAVKPIVEEFVGQAPANDRLYMQRVYETLYENNELYDRIARPILENRWVVIRSSKPCFILPDTCNVFGSHDRQQYVLMPITPKSCLLVLPMKETVARIIPFYVEPEDEIINNITKVLILSARNEFLGSEPFELDTDHSVEAPNTIMRRIIMTLINLTDK